MELQCWSVLLPSKRALGFSRDRLRPNFNLREDIMKNKFFAELSRRLRAEQIQSSIVEGKRLDVFLEGQPVLYVAPSSDVFLLPGGSKNEAANDLYHQVATVADEVY